jgi:ATP-dependent Clp protease ATP-binding subunit ClpC
MGAFIFMGPTGVGKTRLAKALAGFLFDDEEAIVRIDMSEYMEKFSVSRLIGAPPGYVGYDEGGQLTEKVRRRPYSVILLDEIEKAHPDVFNVLLQVLDDGRLTDGQGRTVNFKNTLIIMTSNIGAELIQQHGSIGFTRPAQTGPKEARPGVRRSGKQDADYRRMKEKLLDEVRRTFRPEFLNRIDETIIFNPLDKEDIKRIIEIELNPLYQKLSQRGVRLEVTDKAKGFLADRGFDLHFGARPLKRTIQKYIQDPLSVRLLEGTLKEGARVRADLDHEGNITFDDMRQEALV